MREQIGASVGAAPAIDEMASGALFIITLSSSNAPMALEVPSLAELAGLAVFRSRKVEDGRDRFRMHLGYFESPEAAESVLSVVREHFPAAWVGPAPKSGMGSLDDTSVAQFKFIKAPNTIKSHTSAPHTPAQASRPSMPAAPGRILQRKVYTALATPTATATPTTPTKTIAGKDVLSLLESSPPVPRPSQQQQQMQPRERAAVIGAIQKFAVQLIWSTEPVNLAEVPKLAIFDAYTLYKVQVDRAGRRWYGLRLGFLADPVSARQVALYARSDFSAAAVVPVSDRECDRAAQAAVKELPQAVPAATPQVELELIDVPRTAPKADLASTSRPTAKPRPVTVARNAPAQRPAAAAKPAAARKSPGVKAPTVLKAPTPAKPAPKPAPSNPARSSSVTLKPATSSPAAAKRAQAPEAPPRAPKPESVNPESGRQEKTRRLRSAAELAADLQADSDFELDDGMDPLNDTGVRHLAITVIKKKTKIGKLFKRR